MKYRIIFILFLTALLAGSCSDFLDVKPTGKLIPTEAAQLENLLNNASTYAFFFQDNNRGSALGFLGDNVEVSQNQEN